MSAQETNDTATDRRVVGKVVSNKMNKSVTVAIERLVRHEVYGKFIRRTTKILAHDEDNVCKEGDTVAISECRPLSKRKAWRVVEVLQKSTALEAEG
jgi:small subunit ribosomal protein S17